MHNHKELSYLFLFLPLADFGSPKNWVIRFDCLKREDWRSSEAEGRFCQWGEPILSINVSNCIEYIAVSFLPNSLIPSSRVLSHSYPLLGSSSKVSISKAVIAKLKMSDFVKSVVGLMLRTSLARYLESPSSISPFI